LTCHRHHRSGHHRHLREQPGPQLNRTAELAELQNQGRANVNLSDSLVVETAERRDGLLIRFVQVGSAEATVTLAQDLLRSGFFAPPIFFPIIGRGRAALNVMLRANRSAEKIEKFCGLINTLLQRGPVAAGAGR
jgi:7-keto-8-aminopelargonate synthetase-like enzyme